MDPTAGTFDRINSSSGPPTTSRSNNMEDRTTVSGGGGYRGAEPEASRFSSKIIRPRKSTCSMKTIDVSQSGMDATKISQSSRRLLQVDDVVDDDQKMSSSSKKLNKKNNKIASSVIIPILPIEIALLRFVMIVILGWLIFYCMMKLNAKWTVEIYIPWSFWLLHYLVIFGIIGGGFPFVAPLGFPSVFQHYWNGHGRLILGILQTSIVIVISYLMNNLFVNHILKYPLFGGGAFFGIGLFYITLWWVFNVMTSPSPPTFNYCYANNLLIFTTPLFKIILHSTICILFAIGIFQFVDLEGPDASELKSNPKGPFKATTWFGILVSIIVWVHVFSSVMVFQGYPFAKIRPPFNHFVQLVVTVGLGSGLYYGLVTTSGIVSGSFYAEAICGSQISWSLYHAVAFDSYPYHQIVQPKRGYYNFITSQIILTFSWIFICHIILGPIYHLMIQSNPKLYSQLFTINTLIPWFSLHIVAPLLIIHHLFFMRWPFPPSGPPLGPFDIGIVQHNLLLLDDDDDDDDNENNDNNNEDLPLINEEEDEPTETVRRDISSSGGNDNYNDDYGEDDEAAEEGRGLLLEKRQRESKGLTMAVPPGGNNRRGLSENRFRESAGLNPLSSGI